MVLNNFNNHIFLCNRDEDSDSGKEDAYSEVMFIKYFSSLYIK